MNNKKIPFQQKHKHSSVSLVVCAHNIRKASLLKNGYITFLSVREKCARRSWALQAAIYFLPLLLFSKKGVSKGSEILHGLLTHKDIRIPLKELVPPHYASVWRTNDRNFEILS
jgi:hypothetical protein